MPKSIDFKLKIIELELINGFEVKDVSLPKLSDLPTQKTKLPKLPINF